MIRKRPKPRKTAKLEARQNETYKAGFRDGLKVAGVAIWLILMVVLVCYFVGR